MRSCISPAAPLFLLFNVKCPVGFKKSLAFHPNSAHKMIQFVPNNFGRIKKDRKYKVHVLIVIHHNTTEKNDLTKIKLLVNNLVDYSNFTGEFHYPLSAIRNIF